VSDTAALLEACRLFEQRERLLAAIASDGDIVRNPSGRPVVHPAWAVVVQLWKLLGDYLAQFGLSPSERSRLGLGEIKAAQGMSRIEEMMQRQQRKHPSK
jgi:P27 family predicted phage terminase small subunit